MARRNYQAPPTHMPFVRMKGEDGEFNTREDPEWIWKNWLNGLDLKIQADVREKITADVTVYVDGTNGSDESGDGSQRRPWATIQKAIDYVYANLDTAGYEVTISVADGTYAAGGRAEGPLPGGGSLVILGNTTTPSSAVISSASVVCFLAVDLATITVKGFKVTTTTDGGGFTAVTGGTIYGYNMEFGSIFNNHLAAATGGTVEMRTDYTISGGSTAGAHVYAISFGSVVIKPGLTITLTGTPAFGAFAWGDRGLGLLQLYGLTFSGSATGKRYTINNNTVCFVNGAGSTYLPGNLSGSATNGAQYN